MGKLNPLPLPIKYPYDPEVFHPYRGRVDIGRTYGATGNRGPPPSAFDENFQNLIRKTGIPLSAKIKNGAPKTNGAHVTVPEGEDEEERETQRKWDQLTKDYDRLTAEKKKEKFRH